MAVRRSGALRRQPVPRLGVGGRGSRLRSVRSWLPAALPLGVALVLARDLHRPPAARRRCVAPGLGLRASSAVAHPPKRQRDRPQARPAVPPPSARPGHAARSAGARGGRRRPRRRREPAPRPPPDTPTRPPQPPPAPPSSGSAARPKLYPPRPESRTRCDNSPPPRRRSSDRHGRARTSAPAAGRRQPLPALHRATAPSGWPDRSAAAPLRPQPRESGRNRGFIHTLFRPACGRDGSGPGITENAASPPGTAGGSHSAPADAE